MLLAALLLAAAPGVTDSEVVLGITAPLSGPAAAWGSISLAAEAWARHVNAAGGVNGRKLRVVVKDDAYKPGQAVANVNGPISSALASECSSRALSRSCLVSPANGSDTSSTAYTLKK